MNIFNNNNLIISISFVELFFNAKFSGKFSNYKIFLNSLNIYI